MKYRVWIARAERFEVEAATAEGAVDAAFDASNWPDSQTEGEAEGGRLLDRSRETTGQTVEEVRS